MIYFVIIFVLIWVWVIVEWINSPYFDENTNNKNDDFTTKPNDTHNKGV
jgi:hypothetical protein